MKERKRNRADLSESIDVKLVVVSSDYNEHNVVANSKEQKR